MLKNKIPKVSGIVTNTVLYMKIGEFENKIPDISGLVTNTVFITKIGEVENKILHINRLVTNTTFITKMREIEKKNPNVSGLVTNTAFNTKKEKSPDDCKYNTTNNFNEFSCDIFDERLKRAQLETTNDLNTVKQLATKMKWKRKSYKHLIEVST